MIEEYLIWAHFPDRKKDGEIDWSQGSHMENLSGTVLNFLLHGCFSIHIFTKPRRVRELVYSVHECSQDAEGIMG